MDTESPETVAPDSWPVLNLRERRLLGVLVEKAKTTPDVYPMSVNALVAGSNRNPTAIRSSTWRGKRRGNAESPAAKGAGD